MRSFRSIQRQLLSLAPEPRSESIPTATAAFRVLVRDVVARTDDPAETRSAMDGYAVAEVELKAAHASHPVYLRETGVVPAGAGSRRRLGPGEARRIMTGAPLPPGANAVVPLEKVSTDGHRVCFRAAVRAGTHLRRPGENFRRGDLLLSAPAVLRPQEIGLCIAAGVPRLQVARQVRVGVLSTGSELVSPAMKLRRGQVFDSNRPMVLAQVAATGAEAVDCGSIRDRLSSLDTKLRQAKRTLDILITIGGVSAGDYDIVKLFLRAYPDVHQVNVAMRPARPQAFGSLGHLFWYALPGNPVSAMVAFDRLVRPFLLRAMGHRQVFRPERVGRSLTRIESPRGMREFVRSFAAFRKGEWQVRKVGPEGSSNLRSMVAANAFMILPESCLHVEPGDEVRFEMFSDPPARERTH